MIEELMSLMQINASATLDTIGDITPIFVLIAVLAIALGVATMLSYISLSIEKYRRFKKILTLFSKTLSYATYGSLTLLIIVIPCLVGYWGLSAVSENPQSAFEFFKWIGIIAGGYTGLALLGYITKHRWWKQIFKYHKAEQEQKQIVENMKELPIGK